MSMFLFRFRLNCVSCLRLGVVLNFFSFLLSLTGCSFEASIQSLSGKDPTPSFQPTGTEIVSGSNQNSRTTRGYKAQVSVSHQGAESFGFTTRGHKVFTNIQGTLFKE